MAFAKIEGEIEKILGGKGLSVTESIPATMSDGTQFTLKKYWTVWLPTAFKDNEYAVGSFIEATGTLGAKIAKDWQTKEDRLTKNGERIVELTLNDSKVTVLRPATASGFDAL